MNSDSKTPILCKAQSLAKLAQEAVVPDWHPLVEDENIHFLLASAEEEDALADLVKDPERLKGRITNSLDDFARKNESFGLLSLDGEDPSPPDWSSANKIIRICLAKHRNNSNLSEFISQPFAQGCDLIEADYLPEESVAAGQAIAEEASSDSVLLPPSYHFSAPHVSSSPRTAGAEGPMLWIVDPSSMTSGMVNEKVASVLGKLEADKHLQVISIDPDSSENPSLPENLPDAQGILAVTGDPALGHFLIRSAWLAGIPIVFPIEEPCSPFRFTAGELDHYLKYNNYGRAGLSTRSMLTKAVKSAKNRTNQSPEQDTALSTEAPSERWFRLIAEKSDGGQTLTASPNAYEVICMETKEEITPLPDYHCPTETANPDFEKSLVDKTWLSHPSFAKSIFALQSRSHIPASAVLLGKIADLVAEHLLSLKPTPQVATRLFRNLSLRDPAWLKRTREHLIRWTESGIRIDVARCIYATHTDLSEISPDNKLSRREEYAAVVDLMAVQIETRIFSSFSITPLAKFCTALNMVEERIGLFEKILDALPANAQAYRALMVFWAMVNENPDSCKNFIDHFDDSNHLSLSHGHLLLFTGILTDSLAHPAEAVDHCLQNEFFGKWLQGSHWDKVLMAFLYRLFGWEDEARKVFDETISGFPQYSPFYDFFSRIPDLRQSSGTIVGDETKKRIQQLAPSG